jgi:hypothetical protein
MHSPMSIFSLASTIMIYVYPCHSWKLYSICDTIWTTCVGVAYPSHALDMVPIRTLQVRVSTSFLVTWQYFIVMGDMASLFACC